MTMTSIGYGDILPQVLSEYIICSACMMVSGILWAYIVGAASAVLSNMYPEVTEFEQKMDAFNSMVEDMQVPKKIRLRGREYIRECRAKVHYERNLQAIQSLGMDLQSHISKQKAELHLSKVALFNNCSVLFCGDCAAKMVPMFFEQREVLQLSNQLCVVERGAVGHCGRVLVPWSHWGEDFIVANEMLQSRAPVIAINNAMVVSLSRACADDVLVHHPYERRLFRKAAVRMAFKAAMRIYCFEIRAQEMMPEHVWLHELIEASSNLVSHGVGKRGSSLRSSTGSSLRGSTGSTGSTTNEQVDALVDHFRNSLTSRTSAPDHMMTKNDLFCRLLEAMAPTQEEHLQPLPFPSPDPSRVHTGPVTPPHSPRVQAVREASTIKMRTPRPINAPRAAMVNR